MLFCLIYNYRVIKTIKEALVNDCWGFEKRKLTPGWKNWGRITFKFSENVDRLVWRPTIKGFIVNLPQSLHQLLPRGRTISWSCFLFLKSMHNKNHRFLKEQYFFQEKIWTKAQTVPLGMPICLPWFLVNSRWFKNSYLQDQPINLRTYCVCYFPEKWWMFLILLRGIWR